MAEQRLPTLTQLLGALMEDWQGRIHTIYPGQVTAYDAATRTASVQLTLRRKLIDGTLETIPPIPRVRVVLPELGGVWELDAPLAVGAEGLLLIAARSLEVWRENGGIVDPRDRRRHDLSDAWFIPGGLPYPTTAAGQSTDLVLRKKDGTVEIRLAPGGTVTVTGTSVKLGDSAASQAVALAPLVEANFTTIKNAISAAPVVPGDGGASFKASLIAALAAVPVATGATKVTAS